MGIKEKLPLINSGKKGTRFVGYVLYGFLILIFLGAILPHEPTVTAAAISVPMLTQIEKDNITSSIIDAENGNEQDGGAQGMNGVYQVSFKPNSDDLQINITPTSKNIADEQASYDNYNTSRNACRIRTLIF